MIDHNIDVFNNLMNDELIDVNEDISDGFGWTALHAAVYLNEKTAVQILVNSCRVDLLARCKPENVTALHLGCKFGCIEIVKVLCNRLNEFSRVKDYV